MCPRSALPALYICAPLAVHETRIRPAVAVGSSGWAAGHAAASVAAPRCTALQHKWEGGGSCRCLTALSRRKEQVQVVAPRRHSGSSTTTPPTSWPPLQTAAAAVRTGRGLACQLPTAGPPALRRHSRWPGLPHPRLHHTAATLPRAAPHRRQNQNYPSLRGAERRRGGAWARGSASGAPQPLQTTAPADPTPRTCRAVCDPHAQLELLLRQMVQRARRVLAIRRVGTRQAQQLRLCRGAWVEAGEGLGRGSCGAEQTSRGGSCSGGSNCAHPQARPTVWGAAARQTRG